uniref:BlsC n=1 Tax=Corynebacterium jeikeium TaxID=38289 RepID=Q83ZU4_CORJE|nr:hypothetical protein [Corynebacterium jeikeium]AAP22005.1 BlsC [Corynebacterium jeikeium]
MNTILSRVHTFTHTRVGRCSFAIATIILLAVSLSNAHKVKAGEIADVSELFSGGNSFALFIVGMGMTIFQASEYNSGGMPCILMRVPNRIEVAKDALATSAVISIGYALIANVFTVAVSLAYLTFSGTIQEISYDTSSILLTMIGTIFSYLIVGIIAFTTGDITQSTAGGVFIYFVIYWVLPLSGALVTAIRGEIGNALVQYSLASNVEKLLTTSGTAFIASMLIISAWAVFISIVGFAQFRRYSPK